MRPAPRDTTLYDRLGVLPDADDAQLKRAYHRLALRVHPDKRPGDPAAAAEFAALSEAYQVLSDPQRRELYDRAGLEAGVSGQPLVDAAALFGALFGSEAFEEYVGQLALASAASLAAAAHEAGRPLSQQELQARMAGMQQERRTRLAAHLRTRLQPYPALGKERFARQAEEEARCLASLHFGPELLEIIGYAFARSAAKQLGRGKLLGAAYAWEALRSAGHGAKTQFGAISGAVSLMGMSQDIQRRMRAGQLTQAEGEAALAAHAEQALASIWRMNVLDIEQTLAAVTTSVLEERGMMPAELATRAQALKRLGKVFKAVGAEARAVRGPTRVLSETLGGRPATDAAAQGSAATAFGPQAWGGGAPAAAASTAPPHPAPTFQPATPQAAPAQPATPPPGSAYPPQPQGFSFYPAPTPGYPPPAGAAWGVPVAGQTQAHHPPPAGWQYHPPAPYSPAGGGTGAVPRTAGASGWAAGGGAGVPGSAGPGGAVPLDFERMSVGQLKAHIAARGASLQGVVEKGDLVAIARALG